MPFDAMAAGSARSYPLRIYLPDGVTPSSAFLPSDTLAAELWAGDDRARVATPAATWDPAPPDYRVTFAATDSAGLVGTYRVRVTASRGLEAVEILRDSIEVLAVAGVGLEAPVYCSFEDMARLCTWIGQYLDTAEDQLGFAEQRAMARQWMDGLITRAQPRGGGLNLVSAQNYWTWNSGSSGGLYGTGLSIDRVLQGYLDAGALVLTGPSGAKAVRACACYALALVFGAQPDASARKDAGRYMAMAHSEASTLVVELDTNADGVSEYAYDLGTTNTRYG